MTGSDQAGTATTRSLPMLDAVLRRRVALVATVALVAHSGSLLSLGDRQTDWSYFVWGAQALVGDHGDFALAGSWFSGDAPGGLSLYANYPFLQIGPPSLVLATVLRSAPAEGLFLAGSLVLALGLLTLWSLDREYDDGSRSRRTTLLLGGAAATVTWVSLARFVHLDDALTLAAAFGACLALRRGRWLTVGLLTGFAAASKPWGVVAVALVLAAPTWRQRAGAAVAATAVALLFWGPFLVADAGTFALGDVRLRVSPDSVPALLGVESLASNGPLRLVQLTGGLVVAASLVLRGRWELALAAAFAWRLLLDPSPYAYYLAGLATAALLVDLVALRRPLPLVSLTVVGVWYAVSAVDDARLQGLLNLLSFGGVLLLCTALALRRRPLRPPLPQCTLSAAAPS